MALHGLKMMNDQPETAIIIDKTHYYSEMALNHGIATELGKPKPGRIDSIITIFFGRRTWNDRFTR